MQFSQPRSGALGWLSVRTFRFLGIWAALMRSWSRSDGLIALRSISLSAVIRLTLLKLVQKFIFV
jgi:hypothetical protein